jgi:antirestriction protein ArdC
MEKKLDVYQTVTNQIIAQLESGGLPPWVKPWKEIGHSADPHNAVTKRPYSGVNTLLLWIAQAVHGWPTAGFLTFKQAKEAGGTVKGGEKGTFIVFVKPLTVKEKQDDGTEEDRSITMMRSYYVFNVAQCDGLPERLTAPRKLADPISDPGFDAWVKATGADVRFGSSRACYSPSRDTIDFPIRGAFKSPGHYAATMLHELGHWTDHESRCKRDLHKGRFGNPEYAAEELVAELCSAFLCAELGIDGEGQQHAAYLANWLTALKNDKRFIFTAASAAQKAADFLKTKASVPAVLEHLELAA